MNWNRCWYSGGVLRDPEPQGGSGDPPPNSGNPPQFDPEAFKKDLLKEVNEKVNGIGKAVTKESGAIRTYIDTKIDGSFNGLKSLIEGLRGSPSGEPNSGDPPPAGGNPNPPATQNAGGNPPPQNGGTGNGGGTPPARQQDDPHVQALKREIKEMRDREKLRDEEMQRRSEEAERKEIDATLKTEISKQKFNSEDGPGDLFSLLRPKLTRSKEDGNLYGPEGLTVEAFVAKEYGKRTFMHPPRTVGGSGAGPGSAPIPGSKAIDINEIKPGISRERLDEVWSEIARVSSQ